MKVNIYQIAHAIWNMIPLASRTVTANALANNAIVAAAIASGALDGRIIKSIQQGTITLTDVTSNTATISAVNTAKAFVLDQGCEVNGNDTKTIARVTLTNSTTVTASRNAGVGSTTIVGFVVIEFP